MSVSRKLVAVVVVFLMVFAVSAFAGSVKDLSKHLWTWAVMEELMDEAAHGGVPPVGPVEAENTMLQAQAEVKTIVAGITTEEEMLAARKLADEFVQKGDQQEKVGRALHRLLDQHGNFLKVHGIGNN